jgi:hypothetical protein
VALVPGVAGASLASKSGRVDIAKVESFPLFTRRVTWRLFLFARGGSEATRALPMTNQGPCEREKRLRAA